MKIAFSVLSSSVLALCGLAAAMAAQPADTHAFVAPQDIKWAAGPKSLPPGAEAAVLYGDPAKEGLFTLRLKFPKGYRIPAHTHSKPEVVTVISGRFRVGMAEGADPGSEKAMDAGGFIALAPEQVHHASAEQDTVVQINSVGPWDIKYVNPKDDPRGKSQK